MQIFSSDGFIQKIFSPRVVVNPDQKHENTQARILAESLSQAEKEIPYRYHEKIGEALDNAYKDLDSLDATSAQKKNFNSLVLAHIQSQLQSLSNFPRELNKKIIEEVLEPFKKILEHKMPEDQFQFLVSLAIHDSQQVSTSCSDISTIDFLNSFAKLSEAKLNATEFQLLKKMLLEQNLSHIGYTSATQKNLLTITNGFVALKASNPSPKQWQFIDEFLTELKPRLTNISELDTLFDSLAELMKIHNSKHKRVKQIQELLIDRAKEEQSATGTSFICSFTKDLVDFVASHPKKEDWQLFQRYLNSNESSFSANVLALSFKKLGLVNFKRKEDILNLSSQVYNLQRVKSYDILDIINNLAQISNSSDDDSWTLVKERMVQGISNSTMSKEISDIAEFLKSNPPEQEWQNFIQTTLTQDSSSKD